MGKVRIKITYPKIVDYDGIARLFHKSTIEVGAGNHPESILIFGEKIRVITSKLKKSLGEEFRMKILYM